MPQDKDQFEKFIAVVGGTDFEDFGSFRIDHVTGTEQAIEIVCEVTPDEVPEFHPWWRVHCVETRASSLRLGHFDSISFESEHVLLAEFQEEQFRLGFNGKARNPYAIVGALYEAHYKIADDWIPFSRFFEDRDVVELIAGGFGSLVEAPKSFVEAYNHVLRRYDIETQVTGGRSRRAESGANVPEFPSLKALVLDESFIVAKNFHAFEI